MFDSIISILQNFGFPIACCVFLGYYLNKVSTEYREELKSITSEYKDAITKFQKALDRNTNVIATLNENLEKRGLETDVE